MNETDNRNGMVLNPEFSTTRSVFKSTNSTLDLPAKSGGLRTLGFNKKSIEDFPLITIVTVVFNGAANLEMTINNVLRQTYTNVEYIVIDGASVDGTVNIIRKYQHAIDVWISETDSGIYDAMNKSIDLASGEWINFMNAGDTFSSAEVLENVVLKIREDGNAKIYYGDHTVNYGNFSVQRMAGDINNLWKGSQFCHQSAFVSATFHKRFKYDVDNPITGDFAFFYTAWVKGTAFTNLEQMIATYSAGGLSDKQRFKSSASRLRIIRTIGEVGIKEYAYYSLTFLNLACAEIAKKLLPSKWVNAVRRYRR